MIFSPASCSTEVRIRALTSFRKQEPPLILLAECASRALTVKRICKITFRWGILLEENGVSGKKGESLSTAFAEEHHVDGFKEIRILNIEGTGSGFKNIILNLFRLIFEEAPHLGPR